MRHLWKDVTPLSHIIVLNRLIINSTTPASCNNLAFHQWIIVQNTIKPQHQSFSEQVNVHSHYKISIRKSLFLIECISDFCEMLIPCKFYLWVKTSILQFLTISFGTRKADVSAPDIDNHSSNTCASQQKSVPESTFCSAEKALNTNNCYTLAEAEAPFMLKCERMWNNMCLSCLQDVKNMHSIFGIGTSKWIK